MLIVVEEQWELSRKTPEIKPRTTRDTWHFLCKYMFFVLVSLFDYGLTLRSISSMYFKSRSRKHWQELWYRSIHTGTGARFRETGLLFARGPHLASGWLWSAGRVLFTTLSLVTRRRSFINANNNDGSLRTQVSGNKAGASAAIMIRSRRLNDLNAWNWK